MIALTLLSAIFFGVAGRSYLKKFSHIQKTVYLNILRACSTAGIFIVMIFDWDAWIVVALMMLISAVRPHIDASVIGITSALPMPKDKRSTLNALIDGTYRMARIIGPAITTLAFWGQFYLILFGAYLFAFSSFLFSRVKVKSITEPSATAPSINLNIRVFT